MFAEIAAAVGRELSGHRAKNHVIEMHGTDRFSSFDKYRDTARYCKEQMRGIGLEGVEGYACRADGRTAYGDWLIPRAWDARDAVLRVGDRVLARYPDVPVSLYMYSAPTSPGGLDTTLTWVEDPHCIPDGFNGEIVFTGSVDKEARKALARRGIKGVVGDRGKVDFPDLRGWDNYTFAPRNEEGMFGFSLSFREAEFLRARLRADKVVPVHARVDTTLYDGELETVGGLIPGTEDGEEVLLLAHIYEQGANDNASGAGLGLEVFRVLRELIDRGDLSRPRRSLRLLLGFECCGFMSYVVGHPERMRRTVAAINPDMVGEDLELCGTSFCLHLNPEAAPSCVDALALRLFEDLIAGSDPLFRWRAQSHALCDAFVADSTIGAPAVSIIGLPDRFYHSSLDTPDKVSPRTLEQIGGMLATYIYFLADAGPGEAGWLAEEAAARGRQEIAREAGQCLHRLRSEGDGRVLATMEERFAKLAERGSAAVESALSFARDERLERTVVRLQDSIRGAAEAGLRDIRDTAGELGVEAQAAEGPAAELVEKASRLVPERKVVGPLTLEPLALREKGPFRWSPGWCAPHHNYLLWADGRRSLLEIWENADRGADLREIVEYFEFLAERGYVEWGDGS